MTSPNCNTCEHRHHDREMEALMFPPKDVVYCGIIMNEEERLELISGFVDGYSPSWCPLKNGQSV